MDYERGDYTSNPMPDGGQTHHVQPPPPVVPGPRPAPHGPAIDVRQPRQRGRGWRIFRNVLFFLSVAANITLFLMLMGMMVVFATGRHKGMYYETVIQPGPAEAKIVVVTVEGVINDDVGRQVYEQMESVKHDKAVKGLIIRVNSPGGTIGASDRIYNMIHGFRKESQVPVVAFMQGLAASGGYYTSVACERIVAEPTTITGSIGVIMGHFVLQELLEDKLGILPVVVKSGEKKDWPSSFKAPTEEQLQYLQDRLIQPAFRRFVEVVAEGRKEVLSPEDVNRLADGGIFTAQQALDEHLIDQLGYLEDVIATVKTMAHLDKAMVIEYEEAFSLANLLKVQAGAIPKIDRNTIHELTTPEVMYLWQAY